MLSVASGWTAEEVDATRKIAQTTHVSWHKQTNTNTHTFTIGTSSIGGNDAIGANPGAIGSPGNYRYFDESAYVTGLSWERGLKKPTGGLTMALAEIKLDNTSGRFTPRYMGGNSELYTAIIPQRPVILNGGFNLNGVDQTIMQFSGVLNKQPQVDSRNRQVTLEAADYIDFFQGKYLDQTVMFTAQRTDQVFGTLLSQLGMSTAQYDLDPGINLIPFGLFPSGTLFSDAFNVLTEAENGQSYMDESGIFKFHNRQWGTQSPYNQVQRIVLTGQVIDAQAPNDDHLINVVEVSGQPRAKQINQLVWQSTGFAGSGIVMIPAGGTYELWVTFSDPLLSIDTPSPNGTGSQTSYFIANSQNDNSGDDLTTSVYVKSISSFSTNAKITFANNNTTDAYLTSLYIWGRPAIRTGDVYFRGQDDSSVTALHEQRLTIQNDYIQSRDWAQTYGQMILNDYSDPQNIQIITIRAMPELQLGDLISWQGRYWLIYNIRTTLDPSTGYIQELSLLQRIITTYFIIGSSTIGGPDKISP